MKKILVILFTSLFVLSSCSKGWKAKSLIKSDLKETMKKDWSGYKSIKFSKLDSAFSKYSETEEGMEIKDKIDKIQTEADSIAIVTDVMKLPSPDKMRLLNKRLDLLKEGMSLDSIYRIKNRKFKGKFSGWKMEHVYRGKGVDKSTIIYITTFYFDKNISKIINKTNLSDEDF